MDMQNTVREGDGSCGVGWPFPLAEAMARTTPAPQIPVVKPSANSSASEPHCQTIGCANRQGKT